MKTVLCVLLCLSLVGNASLLLRWRDLADTPPASSPAAAEKPVAKKVELHPITDQLWQNAVSGDAAALQAIRDSGLPPELARALIRASIEERFLERQQALYPAPGEVKYWASNYDRGRYTPKDRTAVIDLRREKEKALDELTPGWREEEKMSDSTLSFLSTEKAQRLEMIEEDYGALIGNIRNEFSSGPSSVVLPSDREKLKYLEKEQRAEIAQLLTPEELESYDLRRSISASSLRYGLAAFEPTEEEFRSIFSIQKAAVDDKFGSPYWYGTPSADERAARTQAQAKADAEIKTLLGEQRFAEYTRSKDYEYQKLTEITNRLQLPKDRAVEAYTLKTTLEEKLQATLKTSTPETQAQNLAGVKEEADREFTRVLGSKGYEAYKSYAFWMQRLAPPPPPPAPKPPAPVSAPVAPKG